MKTNKTEKTVELCGGIPMPEPDCGGIPTIKPESTELVFILDRSGSMSGFEDDTVGGFNAMIEKQKEKDGLVFVFTVLFDNESEVLHDHVEIREVNKAKIKPLELLLQRLYLDCVTRLRT